MLMKNILPFNQHYSSKEFANQFTNNDFSALFSGLEKKPASTGWYPSEAGVILKESFIKDWHADPIKAESIHKQIYLWWWDGKFWRTNQHEIRAAFQMRIWFGLVNKQTA